MTRHLLVCWAGTIVFVSAMVVGRAQLPERAAITALQLVDDGRTVVEASQNGIRVHDWNTLTAQRTLELPFPQVHDVVFHRNDSVMLCAGGIPGETGSVVAFKWPSGDILWQQQIADDVVYRLSAHNGVVAAALHDHSVHLLALDSGQQISVLVGHSKPVLGVKYLTENILLSCSIDQTIRVWDLPSGTIARSLNNHKQGVSEIVLRPQPDGGLPMIASCSADKTVRFWQHTIGRLVRFKRLPNPVSAIAFDPHGKFVVAGDRDGSVHVVNVESLETTTTDGVSQTWINSIVVHPNTNIALSGDGNGQLRKTELPQ